MLSAVAGGRNDDNDRSEEESSAEAAQRMNHQLEMEFLRKVWASERYFKMIRLCVIIVE